MRRFLTVLTALGGLALSAGIASADFNAGDRVHADSFGNLVIHSSAGYKRIIVGMGHTAEAYNATGSYYEPEVVYLDDEQPQREIVRCWRPPYIWHGRSHMYGLPDGVVPQAPLVCR